MKRPTIADIALEAGVSTGAVSYAINGRPGVSQATRERILGIARRLGFSANSAARALTGATTRAVGLVLTRSARVLGGETYLMELIRGVESELSARSYGLTIQFVADQDAEINCYRRWWGERRIDGVFVYDLGVGDRRIPALDQLGLPTVIVGAIPDSVSLPNVWADDAAALAHVMEYLYALGHRRIARVAGPRSYVHTAVRTSAFDAAARRLGLTGATSVPADYTGEKGAQATRLLLSSVPHRPTAIIFDNDVMAVAGLAVALEMGLSVPADLSIVAWDDSPLCRLVHPALSAVGRDVAAQGANAARALIRVIEGERVGGFQQETPRLTPRGSTAPPAVKYGVRVGPIRNRRPLDAGGDRTARDGTVRPLARAQ